MSKKAAVQCRGLEVMSFVDGASEDFVCVCGIVGILSSVRVCVCE